ncbi:MAG: cupin [bacterium]|nr:cupin [bacterium]
MNDPVNVDKNTFLTAPYHKKIEKPWGYELHFVPNTLPYMGKIIHIFVGKRLSLQVHDKKQESWMIMRGQGKVVWEDASGNLIETVLREGEGYTCAVGQKHRLVGITDCDIIEVSTSEIGTTYRLEDDYKRPDETEEKRREEREE